MEIFTDELSETVKSEYVHKIFKGMNDEEIFKAVQLLGEYPKVCVNLQTDVR